MIDPRNMEVLDDAYPALLQTIPPVERVKIASRMYVLVREALLRQLRLGHPDWSEGQIRSETLWRLTGLRSGAV